MVNTAASESSGDLTGPRRALVEDAEDVARLLHDFNVEFETPSPGVDLLSARLRALLATDFTFAVIAGLEPVSVALVTLRPNVWCEGKVALLDEMYVVPSRRGQGIGSAVMSKLLTLVGEMDVELVEINVDEGDLEARRFYERHGFLGDNPETGERSFYYHQELRR
ncbi:MAG: GNAT family N-acetyltransferase [Microthrixaceae bacterium]|nr:GNAT family N-acetyltransferase [Microthrixaceae bacterium]